MRRFGAPALLIAALCVMAGVFVGLSGFTFVYARGASYLSNDPATCNNCHIMRDEFDAWQKSSHHAFATCNDCHVPHDVVGKYLTKIDHGYRHSKGFTFQDFHEPIQAKESSLRIVDQNCVRCHEQMVAHITPAATGWSVDDPAGCIRCHAKIGHGAPR